MPTAAGEIGAVGAHMAVFPKFRADSLADRYLHDFHWQTYANADLLIASGIGNSANSPSALTVHGSRSQATRTERTWSS
jgi:hypothetical protein